MININAFKSNLRWYFRCPSTKVYCKMTFNMIAIKEMAPKTIGYLEDDVYNESDYKNDV